MFNRMFPTFLQASGHWLRGWLTQRDQRWTKFEKAGWWSSIFCIRHACTIKSMWCLSVTVFAVLWQRNPFRAFLVSRVQNESQSCGSDPCQILLCCYHYECLSELCQQYLTACQDHRLSAGVGGEIFYAFLSHFYEAKMLQSKHLYNQGQKKKYSTIYMM